MSERRALIEGIGAIGGVVAARLLAAGLEPTLITGRENVADAIRARGVVLRTTDGEQGFRARVFASLDELPSSERFDVAMLFMKAPDVTAAARSTLPHLSDSGFVVPFQNGVVQPQVVDVVGRDRVVGALLNWGATMHAPGIYEQTVKGITLIGELDGASTPRLGDLEKLVSHFSRAVITPNITGAIWSKLALNCALTTIGGVAGVSASGILALPAGRRVFLETYREVIDIAEACSIRLEPLAIDPYRLYLPLDADATSRGVVHQGLLEMARIYGGSKSSILQSLERRRPTEIDFINGHVAAVAEQIGRPAPINRALTAMIHEIERGTRVIDPGNLEAVLRRDG